MVNIYDTANQLQADLRQIKEYKELQAAFAALKEDKEAYAVFQELRKAQDELQKRQQAGSLADIKPEEAKKMHEIGQKAASFDAVKRLMEKERALSVVVDDIEQALFKPITELYES